MRKFARQRRWLVVLMLASFLLASMPGAPANPVPALAEPSADPAEEIVYIDDNGVIRVKDISASSTSPEVQWFSPTGGWNDVALGDVNNDTDLEIIAVGGGSSDGRLAVFDPVVAAGATKPDQKINGIPWDKLYEVAIPGEPVLVDTGNFDQNVPGPEIIYFYKILEADKEDENDRLRMWVLKSDSPTPTGRGWQQHLTGKFEEDWKQLAVGNLDNSNTDEFAIVSEDDANMQAFRVDGGLQRILEFGEDSRPPKMVAIGVWEEDEDPTLAFSRDAGPPLPSVLVWRFNRFGDADDPDVDELYTEAFDPSPRYGFFADINNNGEEELVLLRNVQSNQGSARMIVRGRNDDDVPSELEQRLDSDNGYAAGAGGDVDGDGRDEIVLIRNNRILIFYEAERSARTNSFALPTDRNSISIGDLDKIGFVVGNQFLADRTLVEGVLAAGGPATGQLVRLTNANSTTPIPYSFSIAGNPSWLLVSPFISQTPVDLIFTFIDTGLQAGVYTTTVTFVSSDTTVINQPYQINVKLTVSAAAVTVRPNSLSFNYVCTDTTPIPSQSITVGGTGGVRYTATILDGPAVAAAQAALAGPVYDGYVAEDGNLMLRDGVGNEVPLAPAPQVVASGANSQWPSSVPGLVATSATDIITDVITVTASRVVTATAQHYDAALVIYADKRAGAPPGNVRVVQISAFCAARLLYMPLIRR